MWACFFLAIIVISLCVVFCKRLEEMDSKVNDLTLRVNNLAEAVRLVYRELLDVEKGVVNPKVKIDPQNKVSQEQVEEAIKRAGL